MGNNTATNEYRPDAVSPPGGTLRDALDERNMSQSELAERTGHSPKHISQIIHGKAPILPETALELERVLKIPADFWNNRERAYRDYLARAEEREKLQSRTDWLDCFPMKQMIQYGWIRGHSDPVDQLREVLSFFGIASPDQWEPVWCKKRVRYRKSAAFDVDEYALAAWLRQGERCAERVETQPYDSKEFRSALDEIRTLTRRPVRSFIEELREICASCGVAISYVPQLKKTRVSGATRWVSPDKALVQLSLRYKKDDYFWFSFFHEAAHILLHSKKTIFLDEEEGEGEVEEEANRFATRKLVDQQALRSRFEDRSRISKSEVEAFAREQGVAPGIVVGQLHHHGYWPYQYGQGLKRTLRWEDATERQH
jgi:plasmid maintenance system antidote protein VapI